MQSRAYQETNALKKTDSKNTYSNISKREQYMDFNYQSNSPPAELLQDLQWEMGLMRNIGGKGFGTAVESQSINGERGKGVSERVQM